MTLDAAGPCIFLAGCLLLLLAAWLALQKRRAAWRSLLRALAVLSFFASGLGATLGGGYILWLTHRIQPASEEHPLFRGVYCQRVVLQQPRPIVMHILTIDTQTPGVRVVVTPLSADGQLHALTTSAFLEHSGAQLAVNANYFFPFKMETPWSVYPQPGDPVTAAGVAASAGVVYGASHGKVDDDRALFLAADGQGSIAAPIGPVFNAVSGTGVLVRDGRPAATGFDTPAAHTVAGVDKSGHRLYLIVVDGKQPHYSEGMSAQELSDLLPVFCRGIESAIMLDGGGSSTMATRDVAGKPALLNSPINLHIVGRERVVANHIGIFADPLPPK